MIVHSKLLGQGSFGEVYVATEAKDPSRTKKFAVKVVRTEKISDKAFADIRNEISVLKKLHDSPHIVQLKSVQRTEKNIYIFMELCEQDLLNYLLSKSSRRLPEHEVAEVLRHIAQGFRIMQENSVIHRDIKLANIMLKDGIAKITDFGFARFLEIGCNQPDYLSRKGSPLYMAPQVNIPTEG